ncbi:unnamed protein product, partial [marine sediment metagenome]
MIIISRDFKIPVLKFLKLGTNVENYSWGDARASNIYYLAEWKKIQDLGFSGRGEMELAKSLGVSSKVELDKWKSLGFRSKEEWEIAEDLGFKTKKEMILAVELECFDRECVIDKISSELMKYQKHIRKFSSEIQKAKKRIRQIREVKHINEYKKKLKGHFDESVAIYSALEKYSKVSSEELEDEITKTTENLKKLDEKYNSLIQELKEKRTYLSNMKKVTKTVELLNPGTQTTIKG